MGNKPTKPSNKSDIYHYTSITTKKPQNTFLSPDNNTCIIVDASNQITIYCYSQTRNEFIKNKSHNIDKGIQDVIYDPYHCMLILYCNDLDYHQFNYNITDNSKVSHTYKKHIIKDKTNCIDTKIIHASIFDEGNILLLVLDMFTIIAMKWNESDQQYVFVKQYSISNCDKVMGVGFHEKRAKMVSLQLWQNHYYLNIYSIGQMLRCIDINDDEMKIQSMDKPHLLLSRLVYENPKETHSIIHEFDIVKNANYHHSQKVMNRLITAQQKINGVTYVIGSHFGMNNEVNCKLIFSKHGDKILYQASHAKYPVKMLHKIHFGTQRGHASHQVSGWMNDFGATHLIDVNTGNSLWSTGESSKDIGIGWTMNDYLIVFNGSDSVKSRCSFNLEGFESETMIAECLFNDVITTYDNLDGFVWDLCLLIALFRGAPDRWYREISLCHYSEGGKNDNNINISLEINSRSRTIPVSVCENAEKFFGITVCKVGSRAFKTHFYESMSIAMKAFGDEDVLIKYQKNNGLVCRNLASPNDVYGKYFRVAQDKWAQK